MRYYVVEHSIVGFGIGFGDTGSAGVDRYGIYASSMCRADDPTVKLNIDCEFIKIGCATARLQRRAHLQKACIGSSFSEEKRDYLQLVCDLANRSLLLIEDDEEIWS
jgi:hypothetical protein